MAGHSETYKRIMAERRRKAMIKRRIIACATGGALIVGVAVLLNTIPDQEDKAQEIYATESNYYTLSPEAEAERQAYKDQEQAEAEALKKQIEEYNERCQQEAEAAWLASQSDPNRYDYLSIDEKQPIERVQIGSLDFDADDAYLLAKIAMAEAESEPTETKALVILTVLNRVWSDKFPGTIKDVIYEKKQFTPISNGRWDRVEPDADCWKALDLIYSGWDESEGALYFETTTDGPTWHNKNLYKLFERGKITFYTEYAGEADE